MKLVPHHYQFWIARIRIKIMPTCFQVTGAALDVKAWIAILLLPIMLFSFIRDLRTLSPLSTFANICLVSGLVIILQYTVQHIPRTDGLPDFAGWSNLPIFFGITMFAFENIGVVSISFKPTHFIGSPILDHVTCLFLILMFSRETPQWVKYSQVRSFQATIKWSSARGPTRLVPEVYFRREERREKVAREKLW